MYTYTPLFEHWWKRYPRKTGKEDAFRAWVKLKLDNRGMAVVLIYAIQAQYKDWNEENPPRPRDKMPYPATWLRSGKWKDYVTPDGTPDEQSGERKHEQFWFGGEEHEGG